MNKHVFDNNMKKINEGKFNGMVLIDIRVQLMQIIEEHQFIID